MTSVFENVSKGAPIEVFAVNTAFLEDTSPQKVNLSIGGELRKVVRKLLSYETRIVSNNYCVVSAYRTEEGKPWVLPIVRKLEKVIADDCSLNHEYLPVLGLETFAQAATKMLLGETSGAIVNGQVVDIISIVAQIRAA
jgi:aspartate aminotransferase